MSTESAAVGAHRLTKSRRAGRELLLEWAFEPLASLLVAVFLRLRVPPPAVVLGNAAAGVLAAAALVADALLAAALLLQVKTLLDNVDGGLARVSGRVTLAGRYLDTTADLVVNALLFLALAQVTGQPALAVVGFAALTLVLSVDFNVTELAREAHGVVVPQPARTGGRAERLLGRVYAVVFAPQDRLVRAISARRLEAVAGSDAPAEVRSAYFDTVTLTALANLGLTTQLAALGVCLALGLPAVYLWLAVAAFLTLVPLQLRRERIVRRAWRP